MTDKNPHDSRPHLLSFDVEEYFHVEAAARRLPINQWGSMELRLEPVIDKILQMLASHKATATFFVLGWVARREPKVVNRIAMAGHEIASHGMSHRMLDHLCAREFRRELQESREILEDISGRPVSGFRAPTFSITRKTAWCLDILAQAGYLYDSSIFPIRHDRYGVPDAPAGPHIAQGPSGGQILELPPLTIRAFGVNWPVGGGGYLRLLPAAVVGMGLDSSHRLGRPGMIYVHPWELDADQPPLPMSLKSRLRHRLGLKHNESKLRWLLKKFRFSDVQSQLSDLMENFGQPYTYLRLEPTFLDPD